ncbi:MAG: FAD-binding oxidoreductase [Pseudomonadota bacterium]
MSRPADAKLQGWGRFGGAKTTLQRCASAAEAASRLASGPLIARGLGRSYGDSAVSAEQTLLTAGLNKFIAFDVHTGELVAEAGVSLADIIATCLPRGWFPRVTPGTKHVTLGGMLAADVHGKNHHVDGSMVDCVHWLDLLLPTGETVRCSHHENSTLFHDTVGGMGLTGIILRASVALRAVETGWIRTRTVVAPHFRAAFDAFESNASAPYSVAWIDCVRSGNALGRSLVYFGEHAPLSALSPAQQRDRYALSPRWRLHVPVTPPVSLLNPLSIAAFNHLYFHRGKRDTAPRLAGWDAYFYPLDAVRGWNRLYGKQGFVQFQAVLPLHMAERGMAELLHTIAASRAASFLAVLKRMGHGRAEGIAFPMAGYTLALDFPATPKTIALVARLHRLTQQHEGRVYLAKDALLTAPELEAMDPRVAAFKARRRASGGGAHFQSLQSERLSL